MIKFFELCEKGSKGHWLSVRFYGTSWPLSVTFRPIECLESVEEPVCERNDWLVS